MQRNTCLDFAKAIGIFLVLFWHLQPIRVSFAAQPTIFTKILGFGLTLFNLQICLVAVPMFLLVSLYLFYQKIEDSPFKGMRRRCLRIGKVYLFWSVCQFALFYLILLIKSFHDGTSNWGTSLPGHRLLVMGGPPLPLVGDSVFYFLFVLFILVLVSAIFSSVKSIDKLFPIIGISIVIVSILYFEILNLNGRSLPYWRVDNFIIYIPLAYFLFMKSKKLVQYIPSFYIGFIIFSAQDIYLRHQGYDCGVYSRVSIVFGSMAILSSILQLKERMSTITTLLSRYSLGIFATHKYWQLIVIIMFKYYGFSVPNYGTDFTLDLQALAIAVVSISLTFSTVLLASRTPIKIYFT